MYTDKRDVLLAQSLDCRVEEVKDVNKLVKAIRRRDAKDRAMSILDRLVAKLKD